jgi:capsular polysaccharide biosynthesis protein
MVEEIVDTQGEPSAVSAADINNNLSIAQLEDTRFLTLTYSDTDKRRAQEVVNNAAESCLVLQAGSELPRTPCLRSSQKS